MMVTSGAHLTSLPSTEAVVIQDIPIELRVIASKQITSVTFFARSTLMGRGQLRFIMCGLLSFIADVSIPG